MKKPLIQRIKDWFVCAYWDVTEWLLFGSVVDKQVYGTMVRRPEVTPDYVRYVDDPYRIIAGSIRADVASGDSILQPTQIVLLDSERDNFLNGRFTDDGFTGDLDPPKGNVIDYGHVNELVRQSDEDRLADLRRQTRNSHARRRYWERKAEAALKKRKARKGKKAVKKKARAR